MTKIQHDALERPDADSVDLGALAPDYEKFKKKMLFRSCRKN
jgi:hypothetical protein